MAKDKSKKGPPNRHLHARIGYLNKVATYLTEQSFGKDLNATQQTNPSDSNQQDERTTIDPPGTLAASATVSRANALPSPGHPSTATFNPPPSGLPLQLTEHLRIVAQKAQIRLARELKHTICNVCCSPFIEGETCIRSTENHSKGGRKPWAEVLVLKCSACGACKRFPVGAKKQKRKALRGVKGEDEGAGNDEAPRPNECNDKGAPQSLEV